MKKSLYTILALAIIILWSSCRKDFESEASTGNLQFSKDTVYLDTVFTDIGSSTYTLKVYNRSDNDIYIPSVRLGQGETSKYRLNVDGVAGKVFDDVEILAKDSMFIFIETTVDITDFATDTQFLYTDAIEFDSGSNAQKVELVTLVQDAVFLYPQRFDDGTTETLLLGVDDDGVESRIEGFFLEDSELNWTNEKPYVIYGYAAVGASKTLSIDPGARIHFHRDSGIIVGNEGSIQVNGILSSPDTQDGEVIFEGDRLEPGFADIPGQWGTIWLTNGSTNNRFDHATIKNATVGILMENNDGTGVPTLTLNNSQIHNSSNVGLLARTGHVEGNNLVIGNAGQASLYCNLGGQYTFKHCTFANYWNNSFRQFPAVLVDNYLDLGGDGFFSEDLDARFSNCIIYGNSNKELILDPSNEAGFSFNFNNCLIRFEEFGTGGPLFEYPDTMYYQDNLLNELPDFKNPDLSEFIIGADSNAIGIGNSLDVIAQDILGETRTLPPDAGAYQHTIFEDEDTDD